MDIFFIHSKFKITQLEIIDLNNNIIKSSKLFDIYLKFIQSFILFFVLSTF